MTAANKKIIISISLFLFIFCFLGLPFTHWWFNGDDFSGLALGKCMQTWNSFWSHALEGHVNKYFYPSHHPAYTPYGKNVSQPLSFIGIYYRPLHCIYLAIAYKLFGLHAYPYFLVNVFLHAFNTTILFNLLTWFTSITPSLFFALLFALHPQIGFRFGAPVNLQYYINVLLLLLTVIMLKRYFDRRKIMSLLLSSLFFGLALLSRETAIIFPALLFVGSWLYQKKISWAPLAHGIAAIAYLIIRIRLYPLTLTRTTTPSLIKTLATITTKISSRYNEALVFLYDSFSLSWLPYGNKLLRLSIVVMLTAIIMRLFWRNKNKSLLVFLALSYLLMLWPSIFGAYSPRYFYEASPILFAFFAALIGTESFSPITKRISCILGIILISLYAFFAYTNLRCRETKLITMKHAFLALAHDSRITAGTRPLCFLAFPVDGFGTGVEQAAWLYLTPPTNPVYYDPATMLMQADANVLEHAGWHMRCAPYYTKNYFIIKPTKHGMRFSSANPHKIHFNDLGDYLSLGKKTIHQTMIINGQKAITDFTLNFNPKYQKQNPLIITWDYEKKKFILY